MNPSTREKLRALFPHIREGELDAVQERLRRYVSLGVRIARYGEAERLAVLTNASGEGKVNQGHVDPRTFPTPSG